MTYWNHRVMRKVIDGEHYDSIHEVYYDDDDKVCSWTEYAAAPIICVEDDTWTLKECLEKFMLALEKPILYHATGKEIDNEDATTDANN